MSLVSAESGRRYGDAELALARELATRAALALDNAALYGAAARARAAAAERGRGGGGGGPGEGGVPGRDEPRVAHPAQRHRRLRAAHRDGRTRARDARA